MRFDPELAEMRFGLGLSPRVTGPGDLAAMLRGVSGADHMAVRFPIEPFSAFLARLVVNRELRKERRQAGAGSEGFTAATKQMSLGKRDARMAQGDWLGQQVQRRVWSESGFRERLVGFWADHFTVQGKAGLLRRAVSPHVEEIIRPHIAGRFADLVIAATTAPMMLHYLDQESAVGPGSALADEMRAKGKLKKIGLNENLAREVLELHTLGVGAGYGQEDVHQLAKLFTGMTYQPQVGFKFQQKAAEPGAETVLGVSYGGPGNAKLADIHAALEDLAEHPSTGLHIARKLVQHFVSDAPDPDLVAHVAGAFGATRGDLGAVYAALLEHEAAWGADLVNVKPPFDYLASAYRALALPEGAFVGMEERDVQRHLRVPLMQMGQPWERPPGPDGWPEEDAAWIHPQGLAARIDWAMRGPGEVMAELPDPRDFVTAALGTRVSDEVVFAARAAESRREGIGLVLASPAFQRR
jgi:uncharacterized protein (DUF1800 family)